METLSDHLHATNTSQRAFAERIDASPGHLSDILSGRREPSLALALKIESETNGAVPVEAWSSFAALASRRQFPLAPHEGAEATAEGSAARSGAAPVETHGGAPASAQGGGE